MPSPQLSNLKLRVDHLLIGVGVVVLVIGAVVSWRALRPEPKPDPQAQLDQGLERMRDKSRSRARSQPPRFVRPVYSSAADPGEPVAIPQPPTQGDPGDLDADEAIASFKQVLGELELAAESGRRLGRRERAELYNRATGSFTALSSWVDAGDPTERALMNDAYAQMKSLMRELDLQPPAHDPDGVPVRR